VGAQAPSRRRSALAICSDRRNLRRTLTIACCVGFVITLINEGDVLLGAHAPTLLPVRIVLNFVVPFISSNLGMLAYATRSGAP
jgi:hypothetical protein